MLDNVCLEECENCSIFGGKNLIIDFGVKDIVVDADDVILVMDKGRDNGHTIKLHKIMKAIGDGLIGSFGKVCYNRKFE